MSVKAFTQNIYQTNYLPFKQEGERQRRYATLFKEKGDVTSTSLPLLAKRVVHEVAAYALTIPVINAVIFAVMRFFAWDLASKFEQAIIEQNKELVDQFLSLGFSPDLRGRSGVPLLFTAYKSQNAPFLNTLLNAGGSPNIRHEGQTFLHLLVSEGNDALALQLVEQNKADPGELNAKGQTVFDCYYEAKNWDSLSRLIQIKGVNLNAFNGSGQAVLHRACHDGCLDLAGKLIACGANPLLLSLGQGLSPVLLAYSQGHHDFVYELIRSRKVDVNAKMSEQFMLFDYAWQYRLRDNGRSAFTLLELGAAPTSQNILHLDVLKLAYRKRKAVIWEQMIAAGWNINVRSPSGETLLHFVKEEGDWAVFRKLIENGAKIGTLSPGGERIVSWEALKKVDGFWTDVIDCGSIRKKWFGWTWASFTRFIGISKRNSIYESVIGFCQEAGRNPLEILLFFGDDEAIQELSVRVSFRDFCLFYTDLKERFPRFDTEWVCDALFKIDRSHYKTFKPTVTAAGDLMQKPAPRGINLNALHTTLFDAINFTNPDGEYYKGEKSRTFDGEIYPVHFFREGLVKMVNKIVKRQPDIAAPNKVAEPEEFKKWYAELEHYLRHVVFWLQKPDVPGDVKATALISMGYIGHVCTDKWKELYYKIYCNLSGEKEQNLSLSDQTMKLLGEMRTTVVDALARKLNTKGPEYDPHFEHELMYWLKQERAIPGPTYHWRDKFVRVPYEVAAKEFDAIYERPSLFLEQVRMNCRSSQGFRELLVDWLKEFSTCWVDGPFATWDTEMVGVPQDRMQQYLEDNGIKRLVSCEGDSAEETVDLYKMVHRGKAWDSSAFLRYLRQGEFNALIAPEKLEYEQLPLVTALFLMRQGFLQFQNSQSFQQSFKTSMPTGSL